MNGKMGNRRKYLLIDDVVMNMRHAQEEPLQASTLLHSVTNLVHQLDAHASRGGPATSMTEEWPN
jgi:hypothetical protein